VIFGGSRKNAVVCEYHFDTPLILPNLFFCSSSGYSVTGGFLKPNPQTRADIHRADVAVMVVKPAGDRAGGMPDRPFLYSAPAGIGAEGVEAEAAEDLLRHVELGAGAEYPGKGESGSRRADYREPRCRTGRCFHYLVGERSCAQSQQNPRLELQILHKRDTCVHARQEAAGTVCARLHIDHGAGAGCAAAEVIAPVAGMGVDIKAMGGAAHHGREAQHGVKAVIVGQVEYKTLCGITGRIVVEIGAPIIAMRQTQTQAEAELAAAAAVLRTGWDAEAEEGEDEDGSFHEGIN
jgi:hypothetical protein